MMTMAIENVNTVPFRALFTLLPDGRVRQLFEQSNDEGAVMGAMV
jgi:hypothetical protein